MLSEQNRLKLDGIVKQMIQNKEPDSNIQFVVDDFKAKYQDIPEQTIQGGGYNPIKTTISNIQKTVDVGKGAIKGGISTLKGMSSLGEKLILNPFDKLLGNQIDSQTAAEKLIPQNLTTPTNTQQKIGFMAEQIAEFLAPSSKLAKIEKGASLIPRMITEGLAVGGQTALQQGKIDNNTKTAAIVGAMFPFAGATLGKAKGVLKPIGEKIQTTVIRPSARDLADLSVPKGQNPNKVFVNILNKYNLGGSLKQTATKVQTTLNDLSSKLSNVTKNNNTAINLNKVYKETVNDILGQTKSKQFGDVGGIQRVLKSLKFEIEEQAGKNGLVDLVDATNIKRGAGTKGSWVFGSTEPDASAVEKVYTNFYGKLKTAIEKAVPSGEIATINKQISELIPISNAVIRRLPVAERNNIIGLTDSIGLFSALFNPSALALLGAKTLSQSGRFGAFLTRLGSKSKPTTAIGERIFGGSVDNVGDIGMGIKDVSKLTPKEIFANTKDSVYSGLKKITSGKGLTKNLDYFDDATSLIKKIEKGEATMTDLQEGMQLLKLHGDDISFKGFNSPTVGETALFQKAKKYPSAEEFVKSQGTPVYHGTDATFDKFSTDVSKRAVLGKGTYVTENRTLATNYGKNIKDAVISPEAKILDLSEPMTKQQVEKIASEIGYSGEATRLYGNKINGKTDQPFDSLMEYARKRGENTQQLVERIKKVGYDGVKNKQWGQKTYAIYNDSILQTKSQLIDIWNKAHK